MPSKVRTKAFPLRHSQWPNSHDLRPNSYMNSATGLSAASQAPDALGSGKRGDRILMPAEFQFRALRIYRERRGKLV